MNVFGPPVAAHGPNKILAGTFAALAGGTLWMIWLDLHRTGSDKADGPADAAIHLVLALLLAGVALWVSRQRLFLYQEGLSYANLLGEKQIRWDDVLRFYCRATKRSVHFIPLGTYYWFRFVDFQGQEIHFGSGLGQASVLADKLVELTQGPLLKRAAAQFDTGADVDFGPISVNRQTGVAIKRSFGRVKHIPWNEIRSFAIKHGHFYISRVGKKSATGPAIAKVPNAFALLGLLNMIFKSPAPAQG